MNQSELEIRIKQKIKYWYRQFEKISTEVEDLQRIIKGLSERIDKVANENTTLTIQLLELKQQTENMSFENLELE